MSQILEKGQFLGLCVNSMVHIVIVNVHSCLVFCLLSLATLEVFWSTSESSIQMQLFMLET